ncbi:hypothetical protein [Ornithinicoccus hortensis]|uniref:Uncharacterized protein n=1 Tax=Ornithinicoccus hortensis TaxID=82346 RepID=A0A542YPX1_9MICO|nr:hypothetical protein [Ornithinicoccus hortensis]TQL50152.1 hypothetical protein FB467_1255 [Ornithinicoccus hortensis]
MGIITGNTYDTATLRAYRHPLRAQEIARRPVKPRRGLFQR